MTIPLSSQRAPHLGPWCRLILIFCSFVTDLEQEFDMTFDAENIDEIATVGDAVDAILA